MSRRKEASWAALLAPLALVLALPSCGSQSAGQDSAGGEARVVASNSMVGDLVENVAGDGVEVTTLVGPNEDIHNFEPSPSVSADLADADVVFENGLELEPWMDDLYESSGTGADRVALGEAEGIELLTAGEEGHDHGGEDSHGEEHEGDEHSEDEGDEADGHSDEHGEYDPHVWHDADNAIEMVEEIEATLSEADPDNADTYEANATEYASELEELDSDIQGTVDEIPEEERKLVTAHDTFGYYAEAYGFEVVGTSLESFSTEASDPAAGETAELADEIKRTGVPAIFPENVSNQAVMENIASEAGVELAPPLYTDALGEPDGEAGTYVEMLRYNTGTIAEGLQR